MMSLVYIFDIKSSRNLENKKIYWPRKDLCYGYVNIHFHFSGCFRGEVHYGQ